MPNVKLQEIKLPITSCSVDEITEGENKGQVAIKLICSPEFSKVLMGYLNAAVLLGQRVSGLAGLFGMK